MANLEERDQGDTRGYNVLMGRPVAPTLSNVQEVSIFTRNLYCLG